MAKRDRKSPGERGIWVQHAPVDILRKISIVDTPGTNAIMRDHEALTAEFIPRSDLVLFITSADRPFTESERSFLTQIQEWGKKIVLVVNKIDILDSDEDVEQGDGLCQRRRPEADGQRCRLSSLSRPGRRSKRPAQAASLPWRPISRRRWTTTAVSGSSCSTPWASAIVC